MQPTSTQQSSSPVVSIQRICRKPEHSFQEPQPLAHMCRFQAKQRHGTDGEKTSYTSELKFKLRTAPVDFGEGISPSASAHCRSAANLSEAAGRSRMTGMARKTCSGRKAAADQQHPTASPRSDCLSQAFPASAEPAPLRLSLILPKSQQNHQMPLRRCSFPERKNGRSELTSHLHSSFMQYEHQGGDTARATAQTAHRKGSQRGLQLKHSLTAQHKLQECLKNADFAAEERLARTSCMPNLNSGGIRGTPQMLEKSNVRCLLKGDKAAAAQANALVRGKAALTGVRARAEVQKHRGKTTATVKQPPVAAVGPAETAFHSPLVTKCSSLQRSVLDCTEHVQCLLGAISSSSPLRKRQPSQEANPLPTPPATIAQEKVEVGAHAERETATTAAATPPASQAGGPTMAVRKTETQAGNSISAKSLISELNVPQSSQTSAESPQSPRFAGKAYQNCGEPTGEEDVEDTAKEFALLRHSEVSFVCVRTLVSYLATCCTISHFGSDDQQQQLNDLSTSPFHCSSSPQIGLEEYLVKRIFRHGEQSINEGVMAVALLSRFLCKQNALLAAALRENSQQQRQRKHFDKCNRDAKNRDKDTGSGSVISTAATATEGFAATAARIGYIEFNYLTAHRLLLTAAFLARKTHRDDHTSIRHWAQLGGVPVEDLVEAESAFVQVVDWLDEYVLHVFFFTAQILQAGPGQPKQWDVGLPFADLAPSSGNSASQGVKDVLNRRQTQQRPAPFGNLIDLQANLSIPLRVTVALPAQERIAAAPLVLQKSNTTAAAAFGRKKSFKIKVKAAVK
ncbi:cyclin domain containing protein, putative [Eimeria praecox]|uniref:Cyclin domain containing protein, putative n=1 Tax=Eimeria praecox TaxID=51316 RepID=U6H4N2_9EIME|nr:cyclin domain containing protein, putative [Eimeria praecox]